MNLGIEIAQLTLIAVGGAWALYNYQRFRRAQARVGLEATARLHLGVLPGESLLTIRLRVANASSVLVRVDEAEVVLIDVQGRTRDGGLQLVPFARADPLVAVYGNLSDAPGAIEDGRLFELSDADQLSLEPGENVDGEMAFLLTRTPDLLAARVLIRGRQGRWGRRPYWWGTFFYIDPLFVETGSGPLPRASGTLESEETQESP